MNLYNDVVYIIYVFVTPRTTLNGLIERSFPSFPSMHLLQIGLEALHEVLQLHKARTREPEKSAVDLPDVSRVTWVSDLSRFGPTCHSRDII